MAKKELTQAQRDQKNARLKAARALKKGGVTMAVPAPKAVAGPVVTQLTKTAKKKPVAGSATRKPGSGGARPNTGFQKLPVADKMVIISFRGLPAQKKKFAKLGGGTWARARIDAGTVKG